MKILLLGGSGYLGKFIEHYLICNNHEVKSPSKDEVNLLCPNQLINYVHKFGKFNRIINCAVYQKTGESLIDEADSIFINNLQINSSIVKLLISLGYQITFDTIGASCSYSHQNGSLDYFDGNLHKSVQAFAHPKRQLAIAMRYIAKKYGHVCRVFVPGTLIGRGEQLDNTKKHFFNGTIFRAAKSIKKNVPFKKFGNMEAVRELSIVKNVAETVASFDKENFSLVKIKPDFKIRVGQIYNYIESKYPVLVASKSSTNFIAKKDKTVTGIILNDLTSQKIQDNKEISFIINDCLEYYLDKLNQGY